ncbi:M15 family metallopeptidase [Microbacterium sp. E-13]|uniref:M15 family metallopeptidase n=1 Tax=Microbacterium sp. E-13 TaxID=3404048 RepID=UPI003CF87714
MTEPGRLATPRAVPETRRAARAMREEVERRARAAAHHPGQPGHSAHEAPLPPPAPEPVAEAPDSVGAAAEPEAADPVPGVAAPTADVPATRRAAHQAQLLDPRGSTPVRHARPRRLPRRIAVVAGLAAGAALLMGSAAMTAMMLPTALAAGDDHAAATALGAQLPEIAQLPVPAVEQTAEAADICAVPEVSAALQAGADEAAVAAAGGGEAFRAALVEGRAPCVNLGDSARIWTVVDKTRPASPVDYRPSGLVLPDGVRNVEGGALRADAASALASLATAARNAGAGEIALESGFRSYQTQQETYGRHFAERGERADQVSARPGYSEHQLGLGADVVACAGACGTLDDLAGSPQGQWIVEHAWEHGWIVRYVEGATPVTGYSPEPWHLRYIGPELAKAYHDGGWTSLEDFFGLGPAPAYLG